MFSFHCVQCVKCAKTKRKRGCEVFCLLEKIKTTNGALSSVRSVLPIVVPTLSSVTTICPCHPPAATIFPKDQNILTQNQKKGVEKPTNL